MKVCAGIVLYNPNENTLNETVISIINQVEKIYVVDNGSSNIDSIVIGLSQYSKIVISKLGKNYGIAFALNTIFEMASNDGYDWVITLDQDTKCPYNLIEEMANKSKDFQRVGIVCPAVFYKGINKKNASKKCIESIKACMTSGSLTSMKAYKSVGGFDNNMFIDLVDNDFCLKLTMLNYKILRINSLTIEHELGNSRTVRIMGLFKKNITYHNPKRAYYIARNYYYFIEKNKKHINYLLEKIKMKYVLALEYIGSVDKESTKKYIRMGLCDAKNNKMGELIENNY